MYAPAILFNSAYTSGVRSSARSVTSLDPQARGPREHRIAPAKRLDTVRVFLLGKLSAHVALAEDADLVLIEVPHVAAHELGIGVRRRLHAVAPERAEDVRSVAEGHVCNSNELCDADQDSITERTASNAASMRMM